MIPQIDLQRQHAALREELLSAVARVLDSSRFIVGDEGRALEAEVAGLCGTRHGVGVASGTDALRLALAALEIGRGDTVVTSAFSFVASASAILLAGATPLFADIDLDTYAIDPASVERVLRPTTKAIIPVHLYGHPAPMDRLVELARARGLYVIEDAAQAIGATYAGAPVGRWGDVACLSFYPTKNLGACGDAGMLVTGRDDVAERLRMLRDHGASERYWHVRLGWCSRLDEVQAAVLRVKLNRLPEWTEGRRRIADRYRRRLADLPVGLPVERPPARHVYNQFTIRTTDRDALARRLRDLGVGTATHYPVPLPGQPIFGLAGEDRDTCANAWRASREVLSLPCFPELRDQEVDAVVDAVRRSLA